MYESITFINVCVNLCVCAATLNGQHIIVKHGWPVLTFAVIYSFTLCVAKHGEDRTENGICVCLCLCVGSVVDRPRE